MEKFEECPVCKKDISVDRNERKSQTFYSCPVCGRFEINDFNDILRKARNKLASYLLYHQFSINDFKEYRYHTTLEKEKCDEFKKQFNSGNNIAGLPVHLDYELVDAWYPKTFSDKIDLILLFINKKIHHIGQFASFIEEELYSMMFVDRKDEVLDKQIWREKSECLNDAEYILEYLKESSLIEFNLIGDEEEFVEIRLTPKGYARIDELLKYSSNSRNVLVAMKFGDETINLREAIRKGIKEAGYIAIFIDEVQHNDFITPELLKHIRDSKFVVVDLTHKNNGAYFEEGYAMGLGKPVIQLCQKGIELHFDVAQKNTIFWENEEKLPLLLKNRIEATID